MIKIYVRSGIKSQVRTKTQNHNLKKMRIWVEAKDDLERGLEFDGKAKKDLPII